MAERMTDGAMRWARVAGRGMIGLRLDLGDAALAGAVTEAAGVPIPAPRRIETAGERRLAWMSPDELLLFLPAAEVPAMLAALQAGFGDGFALAVDLSEARALFRLEGPGAREALAKAAPVDLHPDAFGPGDFRRTRLGQVAAAFAQVDAAAETFELVCFRSLAEHMSTWLDTAGAPGAFPGVFARA